MENLSKIGKDGKGGNGMMIFGVLVIVSLIGLLGYMTVGQDITTTTFEKAPAKGCPDSTGILTVQDRSILVGGTAPSSPTITCGIDGGKILTAVTSGTTTFAVGSALECLISDADSIDKSFEFDMDCGGKTLDGALYYATSDNPAITIKDTDSNAVTNAIGGGATNLSGVSAGATVKFDVYLEGTSGEGTGEMVYVIEFPAGSSANITDVTMGSLDVATVPTVYSSTYAGSKVVAFAVPNVEGAVEPSYRVIASLGTGKDLAGGIYTVVYAGQEFIDDDSTISSGVEDSDGTAKYENTVTSNFYLNA